MPEGGRRFDRQAVMILIGIGIGGATYMNGIRIDFTNEPTQEVFDRFLAEKLKVRLDALPPAKRAAALKKLVESGAVSASR